MESPTYDHDEHASIGLSSIDQNNISSTSSSSNVNESRLRALQSTSSSISSTVAENIEYPPIFVPETYFLRDKN